jgi:hypothetical protein
MGSGPDGEMVDTADLKSAASLNGAYEFESRSGHQASIHAASRPARVGGLFHSPQDALDDLPRDGPFGIRLIPRCGFGLAAIDLRC